MKNIFFIILLLALGVGIGYLIFNPTPTPVKELNFAKPTPTPYVVAMEKTPEEIAASFGIFTNGTFRTFTASMYHKLAPEIFIEPNHPNIVHVKQNGLTWDYFFKTLPFLLDKDCLVTGTGQSFCSDELQKLRFYINGVEDPDALDKVINHKDKLLVSYDNGMTDAKIQEQLQKIPTIE